MSPGPSRMILRQLERFGEQFLEALAAQIFPSVAAELDRMIADRRAPRAPKAKRARLPKARPAPADGGPWAVLGVVRGAPRDVCEAAYRVQAKRAHPDRGGDPATFRRLTEAIEKIRAAM